MTKSCSPAATLHSVVISSCNLKCASRRRPYCRAAAASQSEQLHLHIQKLGQSLTPSVVVLESHFSPPTTKWDIHDCPRLATGFFLHPTLIATSVDAVARVAAASPYEAQIARTLAFSSRGAVMTTRPLAVSFARGVAMLEVVQTSAPEAAPPPRGCVLAESPPEKGSVLLAVSRHQSLGLAMMVGNARGGAAAERSVGETAPWPLDDGSGWIEHGWFGVGNGGDAAPGSSGAVREVSVARIMGSPWFNLGGEVIGVSSWEVKDEADEFLVGFAAPAASVRAVAEYVKTKRVNDPIVMDGWIDGHVIYECV